MSIRGKIFFWFLLPSILIATFMAVFCYFYTRQIVKQNIFGQLEIAADQLQKHVQVFLESKKRQIIDFCFDDFIRDCTEEITKKEKRREFYTTALNTHLITNKIPLNPNILELFIINFNGKIIASSDENHIGENVSSEKYFSEVELLNTFTGEPHYDSSLEEIVIEISAVILSKVEQEAIGVIVSRIKLEQEEDEERYDASAQEDNEWNYSQLIDVNKVWTKSFGSDGFIRDCTEEITRRNDRVQYYTDRLNNHLVINKKTLDDSIISIFVIDLTGNIIASTELGLIGKDVSDKEYFLETMEHGSFVSDLYQVPAFKKSMFEITTLLTSRDKKDPIGIIVNRYSGDSLKKVTLSGIKEELGQAEQMDGLGETGEVYIVNRDKLMITESRFIEDSILKQVVNTEGVRVAFGNRIGMVGIYPNYRDIQILGASKYLEEMDWVVLAEKDVSEAFAPIVSLRNFVIIVGVTGIIVVVIIAIYLSLNVTRPINKLVESAHAIADGDLTKKVNVKGEDEIGYLANSFDTMRIELGKSFRNIERHRKELQHLSERIVLIQEEERNKLSRELHDQTGQALIALKTNLEVIDKLLPGDAHEPRKWILESKQFLVETIQEIRSLSFSLKPPMLDDLGLVPTIESYSKDFSTRTKIAVNIKSNLKDEKLRPNLELSLYRMVQEALTNVLKHSEAKTVQINIYRENSTLVLSIKDDGKGFDIKKMWQGGVKDYGIGLLGMRERFASAGADFQVYSTKGKGTQLIAKCQTKFK
jgi:signal transduction histidine kinase